MDLFDRQWSSYRAIVEHNLMEHRQVADATADALQGWLAQRPAQARAPSMVDLGCGDLALLAPLLQRLPLGSYTGLDRAAVVLPLAQRALAPVPYACQWLEGDLLTWATTTATATATAARPADRQGLAKAEDRTDGRKSAGSAAAADHGQKYVAAAVDILHSAFAIHHLDADQKATFLQGARQRISADGVFLWADVFREPGENRRDFLQRYSERVRSDWHQLTAEQAQHVIDHLNQFDIPADRTSIQATAETAGWHWRWSWQGTHRAEALAVLTPA